MPLPDKDVEYECIICEKTFESVAAAEGHAKGEHKDKIVEEEWGHYFNEEEK